MRKQQCYNGISAKRLVERFGDCVFGESACAECARLLNKTEQTVIVMNILRAETTRGPLLCHAIRHKHTHTPRRTYGILLLIM